MTLNNSSFLSLEPGSIGNIFYFRKKEGPVDERQKIVDNNTREAIRAGFNPPPGLSKDDYNNMFLAFLVKERTVANDMLEDYGERYSITVQVGNKECVKELEALEKDFNFISYENPHFVDFFKQLSSF